MNNAWLWDRDGKVEKAANVYGIGTQLDNLHVRAFTDYSSSSYNYNIESDVNGQTANNVYVFATAVTKLQGTKSTQMVATN